MSAIEVQVASRILKEHYGDIVDKVCTQLIKYGSTPLRPLAQELSLKVDQVKKALCVLIQHNIVTFKLHKRGFVEYSAKVDHVLMIPRYPHYIYCAKTLYGDAGELIVEEFLQHGQMLMSAVVDKVSQRLSEAMEAGQKLDPRIVPGKFEDLVNTHFLQRLPAPPKQQEQEKAPSNAVPKLELSEKDMYRIPQGVDLVESNRRKRKRSVTDSGDADRTSKKVRGSSSTGNEEVASDAGVVWKINFDRFHQHLRDLEIVAAVCRRVDWHAGEIVRTMLRVSELTTDFNASETIPIGFHDIMRALPPDLKMTRNAAEQYFKLLSDDQTRILQKIGESGGGTYKIDLQKASQAICTATVESIVQERFGSKSFRIFKTLLIKKHLEQKQVEEFALIPAKEAKELLYKLFAEHIVTVQEIPRTPDHAPSRTFYLFTVNISQVSRMMLERCYKTLANLMSRRDYETKENRRLIEKAQRVEAITKSLQSHGADPTQTAEIEDMITAPEKLQLEQYKRKMAKLEQSELQVDGTIFILSNYIQQEGNR
ncbi:DNA-directed RNA polymerase III subunit RPC3-like [Amphiura filiformis]|uniref:DNA-directed RNA polymerase III subunit RPC3-like n=1 Tax=Amphiura filiformis TaxID=82378 RepID=UPI003B220840